MTTASDTVEIVALRDRGLGNTSYVIGAGGGAAIVVDPSRDPRPYLEAAADRGWRIIAAADTHLHADFLSGARELAALGARVIVPGDAGVQFPAVALTDGDQAKVGDLALEALATPGHTPEHTSYLLLEGTTPLALFGGGTVMVGGMARPDLIAPEQTEPLARAAFRTVRRRLAHLEDSLPLYPTHGAGSFCAATTARGRTSTLGDERRANPLFTATDEDTFVASQLAGLGSFPPYFLRLRARNKAGPAVIGAATPPLLSLTIPAVDEAVSAGAEVVDVRSKEQFAAGHVPGSLSIPLRSQFAVWLGWLVDIDRPLVFVTADDTDLDVLVRECLKIGVDRLVGEIEGGIAAWRSAGRRLATVELIDPKDADPARLLLDVRQDSEWESEPVEHGAHVELGELAANPDAAPHTGLLVACAHGERAITAASILERAKRTDVQVLAGGARDLHLRPNTGAS